jgi:hypothetical protein
MLNKFRQAGHFITRAGSLHKQPLYPHRSLKTMSNKFKHGDLIKLALIVPSSNEPTLLRCRTTDQLSDFVKLYKGELAERGADGFTEIIPRSKYSEVSPSVIYEIISPFFTSLGDEHHHWQVVDKAFEDKSREALIRYLEAEQFVFRELSRVIKVDGGIIAQWGGVFELEGGEIWFLECKHCVTIVFYHINLHLTVPLGCNPTSIASFEKEHGGAWQTCEQR